MSRLPIRLRLTLTFTLVMALVLAATGLFLYVRLGHELDASLNAGLRSQADAVTALVQEAGSGLSDGGRSPLAPPDENYAQVIDETSAVVDSTPGRRSAGRRIRATRPRPAGHDCPGSRPTPQRGRSRPCAGDARSRAGPAPGRGRGRLPRRAHRGARRPADTAPRRRSDRAALASLAGYALAAAALRPVESMRRGAADDLGGEPWPAAAALEARRRDPTARSDAERDARAARNGTCPRARVRCGREPRAPNARSRSSRPSSSSRFVSRARGGAPERASVRRGEVDRLAQLAEDLLAIARWTAARSRFVRRRWRRGPLRRPRAPVRGPRDGCRTPHRGRRSRRPRARRRRPSSRASAGQPRRQRAPPRVRHDPARCDRARRPGRDARDRRGKRLPGRLPGACVRALFAGGQSRRPAEPDWASRSAR